MTQANSYPSNSFFVIIGLGNPGTEYEYTRHNIGFMVVNELNGRYQGKFKLQTNYLWSKIHIDAIPSFLIKPITYMNNSGLAVKQFMRDHSMVDCSRFLIILDDIQLPFGTIRLRASGSDGGQKGLRSIIEQLGSEDIPRLRIGIGDEFEEAVFHVLNSFTRKEKKALPDIISFAADAAASFVVSGIQRTMTIYNRNILIN